MAEIFPDLDEIWRRIGMHAGETFYLIRGEAFTYVVRGTTVVPDRTRYPIHRSNFDKALGRLPFDRTTTLQDLRAPSYLYAILMDTRIRKGDW
jgi:hypothetical protein